MSELYMSSSSVVSPQEGYGMLAQTPWFASITEQAK